MTRHPQPLSPAEMAARDDAEIDFSDQPELGTSFRAKARVVMPEDLDACPIGVRPAGARAGGGVAGVDFRSDWQGFVGAICPPHRLRGRL